MSKWEESLKGLAAPRASLFAQPLRTQSRRVSGSAPVGSGRVVCVEPVWELAGAAPRLFLGAFCFGTGVACCKAAGVSSGSPETRTACAGPVVNCHRNDLLRAVDDGGFVEAPIDDRSWPCPACASQNRSPESPLQALGLTPQQNRCSLLPDALSSFRAASVCAHQVVRLFGWTVDGTRGGRRSRWRPRLCD